MTVIDPRKPNFAAMPAPDSSPFAVDTARLGYTLLLEPGALLEPAAVEQMAWYLHTHPDAAAVTTWHVVRDDRPRLDDCGARDWHAILAGRSNPAVALCRTAVLEKLAPSERATPRKTLLALGEREHPCGTIDSYLCWGPARATGRPDRDYPNLGAGRFPLQPRLESLTYEPVPPIHPAMTPAMGKVRPRTILFIVPWYTLGGADKFNLRLGRQLLDRGWNLTFAATNRGDQSWLPDFCELTADVHVMPWFIRPDAGPLFLLHLIRMRRPDVVLISNSELGYLCLPYLRHHCPGPLYIDYSHMEELRWKNGGWSRYGAGWQDLLDLNIVTSEHLKRWMVSRGADADRVEVATINEDPALWVAPPGAREEFRRRHRIPAEAGVVLYAARICEQKKPHVFIETVHALAKRGVKLVALVAGDGPDRAYLEKYVATHGLSPSVRFLLSVPPTEMPAVYAASDVLFLSSEREGIALVMFEAMAAGLPVVGAAVGGQPELVTPECGVLIPPAADAEEVAAYSGILAELLADPQRRARMGAAGKARIMDHFSLKAMGERMTSLFERAGSNPARPMVLTDRTVSELATLAVEFLRVDNQPVPPPLELPLRYRIVDRLNLTLNRLGIGPKLKRMLTRGK